MTSHRCAWPACTAVVPINYYTCKPHWFMLPAGIRNAIWAAYRPGQERTMSPSPAYIAAAHAAQEWIAQAEAERAEKARAHDRKTRDLFGDDA